MAPQKPNSEEIKMVKIKNLGDAAIDLAAAAGAGCLVAVVGAVAISADTSHKACDFVREMIDTGYRLGRRLGRAGQEEQAEKASGGYKNAN